MALISVILRIFLIAGRAALSEKCFKARRNRAGGLRQAQEWTSIVTCDSIRAWGPSPRSRS